MIDIGKGYFIEVTTNSSYRAFKVVEATNPPRGKYKDRVQEGPREREVLVGYYASLKYALLGIKEDMIISNLDTDKTISLKEAINVIKNTSEEFKNFIENVIDPKDFKVENDVDRC